MHTITEIKYQNQQDCFSMLYLHLVRSLVDRCGRSAEGVVREAVRRMGKDWGCSIRKKHVGAGVKTNLLGLYNIGLEYRTDPRMCEEILRESEEVRLWEVRTCPLGDLWNKAGEGQLGLWYCEEFQRGLIAGYTDGKGQMNQSTFLTCPRDNHCRFSAYFRAANLEKEQLKNSFACPGESPTASGPQEDAGFAEGIRVQFIKLYYYLLSVAQERYGSEGECSIALGLRRLADVLASTMRLHAASTLNLCDADFLKQNFPVSLNTAEDAAWQEYSDHGAPQLMQNNLLDRLKKLLNLTAAAA